MNRLNDLPLEPMSTPRYRLVFSGKLRKGFKYEEVRQSLAQLLKIPLDQAGHLIQGARFRIKKSLSREKAERLQQKITARGAICSIEPIGTIEMETDPGPMKSEPIASESRSAQDSETTISELSLDPSELAGDDDETRPLATVAPTTDSEDERIVLETPSADIAAYKPDDDSENIGTFYERNTVAEAKAEQDSRERRKRQALLIGGLLLVVVALAVWQFSLLPLGSEPEPAVAALVAEPPKDPKLVETNRRLETLNRSIRVWMIQYGSGFDPAQVTLERLQQDLQIGDQEMRDGWGTALRFEPEQAIYRVISAGPDQEFGTADDLRRETKAK